ncbi:hypothetical protein BDP27DRAFT_1367611 [Rhodocollybia butyracea]|uniref:Uncharacterized protein n=1 Tax=Rhodocollybia butyracea TaxID=206335 RepID=A0A9P5U2J7_9AGAR|nr:hypothetical protein BDP27DRAFT_1367611 [Rhodocollybia butyracea]
MNCGHENVEVWEKQSTKPSLNAKDTKVANVNKSGKLETQETVLNKLIELSEECSTRRDDSLNGVLPIFMNKALKDEQQHSSRANLMLSDEFSVDTPRDFLSLKLDLKPTTG